MKLLYRHKILLGILQAFGGNLSSTNLQKYLFLFTQMCQKEKSYEFVPYQYGCFSFQSYADRRKLVQEGILTAKESWVVSRDHDFIGMLDESDRRKITLFAKNYHDIKGDDLVRKVYKKFPYYAIKSEIASELMNTEEQAAINAYKPSISENILYTIGYEGNSFENYLNRLIMKDVRLLVDVRKNPLSRKYGFSKRTLSETLKKLGIEYRHMPELGIVSEKRKYLKTEHDYRVLLDEYEETILKDNEKALKVLAELVKAKGRVALTCFEAESCMCHRGRVAKAVEGLPDWEYEVVHI